jgi:biopolymer transport protein ExbB/TolQ
VNDLQQVIYDVASVLLWPVLIAAVLCLVWVLVEMGYLLYELWLRFRYRDLEALEARTLRARKAFADGKPRTAYRYLQENTYSLVVTRFLFDLVRNYQTMRLEAKPLKLLQEYEFYTIKRLERTRILTRLGPILGLMGTLIPLSPALVGLAEGDIETLSENLTTAFSVTVIGLLIGGLAFVVSIIRDRMYSQDISDMEYLLELLEGRGGRLESGRRKHRDGSWDEQSGIDYEERAEETKQVEDGDAPAPGDAAAESLPGDDGDTLVAQKVPAAAAGEGLDADDVSVKPLSFDDPDMDWRNDDDPFHDLGPVEGTGRGGDGEPPPRPTG